MDIDMDKRQIAEIMNSHPYRIAKSVMAAILIGRANRSIKEGQVFGGLAQLAVAGVLGGTAIKDKCPANMFLDLPIDSQQARLKLNS